MENIDNLGLMELRKVQQEQDLTNGDTYGSIMVDNPKRKEMITQENILQVNTNEYIHKPFIEANTIEVNFDHLKNDCIVPVFSKDNELTISHNSFIDVVFNAVTQAFPQHSITPPEIRVSHQIKGRTPNAIHKSVKDLLDNEKTIYYERMAFIIQIPGIKDTISGNELSLTVGGVSVIFPKNRNI